MFSHFTACIPGLPPASPGSGMSPLITGQQVCAPGTSARTLACYQVCVHRSAGHHNTLRDSAEHQSAPPSAVHRHRRRRRRRHRHRRCRRPPRRAAVQSITGQLVSLGWCSPVPPQAPAGRSPHPMPPAPAPRTGARPGPVRQALFVHCVTAQSTLDRQGRHMSNEGGTGCVRPAPRARHAAVIQSVGAGQEQELHITELYSTLWRIH